MAPRITVALPIAGHALYEEMIEPFLRSSLVSRVLVMQRKGDIPPDRAVLRGKGEVLPVDGLASGATVCRIIDNTRSKYLLWVQPEGRVALCPGALERFVEVAESSDAGMVYGDYAGHPVNDYQTGSIRDTFDFGPVMFFNARSVQRCLKKYGAVPDVRYAGLYDLRLKLSLDKALFHVAEPLSMKMIPQAADAAEGESHFAYVDPRYRSYQMEMEQVATDHLKRLGAFLGPNIKPLPVYRERFPVEASVIIPVRNRVRTIADAVGSALGQKTDFPYNVLVVDNHSTDGTTAILKQLSAKHDALKHVIPERTDLGIGGCWNEAVQSPSCGRYAVQLDSDDLYSRPDALQRIADIMRNSDVAMVIGSYTIVNENLKEIPPGLIDHREWTDHNGRNNALRINGLGAPRAFRTSLVRRIGFPNVSYGEDYAVALRISREYGVGRIYDSLYLCRRWAGNTDAALSVETANRYDAYKDKLRTLEILARRKLYRARAKTAV